METEGILELPKSVKKATEGISESSKFGQKTIPINPARGPASKVPVLQSPSNSPGFGLPLGNQIKPQVPNPQTFSQIKPPIQQPGLPLNVSNIHPGLPISKPIVMPKIPEKLKADLIPSPVLKLNEKPGVPTEPLKSNILTGPGSFQDNKFLELGGNKGIPFNPNENIGAPVEALKGIILPGAGLNQGKPFDPKSAIEKERNPPEKLNVQNPPIQKSGPVLSGPFPKGSPILQGGPVQVNLIPQNLIPKGVPISQGDPVQGNLIPQVSLFQQAHPPPPSSYNPISLSNQPIGNPYSGNPALIPQEKKFLNPQNKPIIQVQNFHKVEKKPESAPVKDPTETPKDTEKPETINTSSQSFTKVSYSSLLDITSYLCSKTIPFEINNHCTLFNTKIHLDKEPSLKCKKCQQLKLKFTLECSHQICIQCFILSIENYTKKPSPATFVKTSCPICKVNFSDNDLKNTLNGLTYKNFQDIRYDQMCNKCNLRKNLRQEYFTELTCLHMCGSCYADEIYSGSTKCFCCNLSFNNLENTKGRHITCHACKFKGDIIDSVYRSFHRGHIMCFKCLNKSTAVCEVCHENLGKREKKALSTYINKVCAKCFTNYALTDFTARKDYKGEFICITCSNEEINNEEQE